MWFGGRVLAVAAQDAMYRLRKDVFEHTQTLSLRFFDRQPIGDLMSRITNDLDSVGQLFDKGLYPAINSAFTLVITTVLMFIVSWQLSIAVDPDRAAGPRADAAHVALLGPGLRRAAGAHRRAQRHGRGADHRRPDRQGLPASRTRDRRSSSSSATRPASAGVRANFVALTAMPLSAMLSNLDVALVALAGGWLSINGTVSVGTVAIVLHLRAHVRAAAQPVRPDPEHGAAGGRGRDARLRDPRRGARDRRPAGRARRRPRSRATS